jgi:hypothetical protein
MFVVLRKEVGNPEGAVRHFFKERGGAIPFIENGEIDAIFEDEKADQEGRRKDQQWFDESGNRLGQHRSQLTLPVERERKKRRTCRRRGSNPHDLARAAAIDHYGEIAVFQLQAERGLPTRLRQASARLHRSTRKKKKRRALALCAFSRN